MRRLVALLMTACLVGTMLVGCGQKEEATSKRDVQTKGYTIVPVNLYTNDKGLVKLTIAMAKGKHTYDKSQTIKERDLDREMKNI